MTEVSFRTSLIRFVSVRNCLDGHDARDIQDRVSETGGWVSDFQVD